MRKRGDRMTTKKKSAARAAKKTTAKNGALNWGVVILCCCATGVGGYLLGSRAWARRQAALAADAMEKVPGVRVEAMGDTVLLTGEAQTMDDYNKARAAARSMNAGCTRAQAMNLVTLSESGKESFLSKLRSEIRNRRVRARFIGNRLVLEGIVRNDFEADKAVELAKAALGAGDTSVSRETAADAPGAGAAWDGYQILDMIRIRAR